VADRIQLRDPALKVASIALTVGDAASASRFFQTALDCEVVGEETDRPGGAARSVTLRLGSEVIVIDEHRPAGRPVPADSCSHDLWFQHLAIVVSDIRAACDRLNACGIRHTSPAPQRLPAWNPNAGGIQASYFRDPDGHPLELISFPPDKGEARWQSTERLFLGVDHTAITVSSTEAALRFYGDGLGLAVRGGSENWGVEQDRLSGVAGARVRITSLRGGAGPGVEFLHYVAPATGRPSPADARAADLWHVETRLETTDVAALLERVASAGFAPIPDSGRGVFLRDPNGHAVRLLQTNRTARGLAEDDRGSLPAADGGRPGDPVQTTVN
jgi:catechol 2,3-dioxygenase-like lactoylglutathione lyase family enzyme